MYWDQLSVLKTGCLRVFLKILECINQGRTINLRILSLPKKLLHLSTVNLMGSENFQDSQLSKTTKRDLFTGHNVFQWNSYIERS